MRLFHHKKLSSRRASQIVAQELLKRFQLKIPLKNRDDFIDVFLMPKKEKSRTHHKHLIYIGNALIRTITTEWVFEEFSSFDEGNLTQLRVILCNQNQIEVFGKKLNLLDISKKFNDPERESIPKEGVLLKTFMGRLFLDMGYNYPQVFYIQHVLNGFVNRSELQNMVFQSHPKVKK